MSSPCLLPPIPFLNSPREKIRMETERQRQRAATRGTPRVGRDSEHWHAIGAYLAVSSHHALGACESVSVGAKMGSSSVVDTQRDKVGFGLVFRRGRDGKPMGCGHAARFARVEGEVRAEDFLEGKSKCRITIQIHKGVLAPPTRARTVCPSLAVLRNIVNGGDGSPKCGMIFEI